MNNREIAAVVWLGVLLVCVLVQRDLRRSLGDVIEAAVAPRFLLPLLAMVGYVCGLVYLGWRGCLWNAALLSDTVTWFLATGLVLCGKSVSVFSPKASFRAVLFATFSATVFVEVFVNLYVFPLPLELVLTPVLSSLGAMSVIAKTEDQFALVGRLIDRVLVVIGLTVLLYVAINLVRGWSEHELTAAAQRFALPAWLTLGTMPCVAVLGAYLNYDTAFAMVRWASDDRCRRARAYFALVTGLHVRAREVGEFNGMWCKELVAACSLPDARRVVRRFRDREPGDVVPSPA